MDDLRRAPELAGHHDQRARPAARVSCRSSSSAESARSVGGNSLSFRCGKASPCVSHVSLLPRFTCTRLTPASTSRRPSAATSRTRCGRSGPGWCRRHSSRRRPAHLADRSAARLPPGAWRSNPRPSAAASRFAAARRCARASPARPLNRKRLRPSGSVGSAPGTYAGQARSAGSCVSLWERVLGIGPVARTGCRTARPR